MHPFRKTAVFVAALEGSAENKIPEPVLPLSWAKGPAVSACLHQVPPLKWILSVLTVFGWWKPSLEPCEAALSGSRSLWYWRVEIQCGGGGKWAYKYCSELCYLFAYITHCALQMMLGNNYMNHERVFLFVLFYFVSIFILENFEHT